LQHQATSLPNTLLLPAVAQVVTALAVVAVQVAI
jgi:hypothetical protein